MKLDFDLVNRALLNIGMAALAPADKAAGNEAWQTAKRFYLETMLETLARAEWAGAKRRRELTPVQMPVKQNPDFAYVYSLPLDCARPVELDGHVYFKVEAGLLFTDAAPARLLYVSNGRRLIDQPVLSGGGSRRRPAPDYITGGDARRNRRIEWGDNTVACGGAGSRRVAGEDGTVAAPPPAEAGEDFPDYGELRLEPNFYLYWECLLSAKYALRLTGQPGLADSWFAKAMAFGNAAEADSLAASAGKKTAPATWQEQLGLR